MDHASLNRMLRMLLVPWTIITFTLIMASLCGNTWLYRFYAEDQFIDRETHIGLWETCLTKYDYGIPERICVTMKLDDVPDYIQVTISFLILATLPSLMSIVAALAFFHNDAMKGFIIGVFHLLTTLFLIIGMSTYTATVSENDQKLVDFSVYTYGWSHNIGWLATVLAIFASVASFFIEMPKLPHVRIEFQ